MEDKKVHGFNKTSDSTEVGFFRGLSLFLLRNQSLV
jgi:hypothetical protein